MALTLDKEQKLTAVGLAKLYVDHKAVWDEAARHAYTYVRGGFPHGAAIRPDDVAKPLTPVLEVNATLTAHLDEKRLKQKYWVGYFADLIIDKAWAGISAG
jgi:hypothetical protein